MSEAPRLSHAPWLDTPALQAVFEAIVREGDAARAVGGAVRNTLLGEPVDDIDIATTATPPTVMERARAGGLKAIPTGIEHGTVTVVSRGIAYEVTTLREDVETFGRRATVRFSRDWRADAARRDFTMNALYVDADGTLHDPGGEGLTDCLARRVRFIGEATQRIREDYLRILRFFRFHARYGGAAFDEAGLAAVVAEREGLRQLSRERIGGEIRKILPARYAVKSITAMMEAGIAEIVLGAGVRLGDFARLAAIGEQVREAGDAMLRLAALTPAASAFPTAQDIAGIAERLRLSNAETMRIEAACLAAPTLRRGLGDNALRERLYRLGRAGAVDAALLAWCRDGDGAHEAAARGSGWADLLARIRTVEMPVFPVAGRDLLTCGMAAGPQVGERLRALEKAWIASGFTMSKADLLAAP